MIDSVTIRQRPCDVDFMRALRAAAKRCDRTPAHFARQLVLYALLELGELRLDDQSAGGGAAPLQKASSGK
jgi:hypothetical protein